VLRALKVPDGADETVPEDFVEEREAERHPLPGTPEQEERAGRFERRARTGPRV
jgi:hypothetical protein